MYLLRLLIFVERHQSKEIFFSLAKNSIYIIFFLLNSGAAVGEIPACTLEYMDIYAEVQSPDPAELINSPFGGRYCGPIKPRRRISLFRAIALSFFTSKHEVVPDLFSGRFQFINESKA